MNAGRCKAGRPAAILAVGVGVLLTVAGPRIAAPQGAPSAAAQDTPVAARASPAQRQIAEHQAALERLATLEREWQERAEADRDAVAERVEELVALEAQLATAEAGSEVAATVFDHSKELARGAIADLRKALRRAAVPSEIPRTRRRSRRPTAFSTSDQAPANLASGSEAQRLAQLGEQRQDKTLALEALELRLRDESIDRHAAYAGSLWRMRLAALEILPAARRDRLSSLTRERWDEILFDFDVVRLVVRLQWFRLRLLINRLPHLVRDFFAAATVGGALLRVVVVVLLWRWVHRRRPRVLERWRQKAAGLGRARVVAELIAAAATWGIFLLGLAALHWALGPKLQDLPILGSMVFVLAAVYGAYRLAADLGVAVLTAGAEHTAFEMTRQRRSRLDRSVRRVMQVVAAVFLAPAFYAYRLEGGVLLEALRQVGRWAVLVAMVAELAPWRRELADACLTMRASGRWASLLRRTRDHKLAILLAPLSFLWLAAGGLWALGLEIVSGHERGRLATTYLARRRIEKEAEERGYADIPLDRLPAGLEEVLDERVRPGDLPDADHLPSLEEACRSVAAWRRGEGGGAFLLAGEQGIGKRAWIDRFCAREPDVARLTLDRRLLEPAELVAWLGRGLLGEDEPPAGRAELAAKLGAGDRRIVVLEGAENLFLARVDGYHALAEMTALAGETRLEVFWLLSMEGLALNHLRATAKELTYLGRVAVLPDWQEAQIHQLLRRRLAAGGFTASYVELLGELSSGEDAAARAREGEKAYISLLADFAGGNPRVALHYFLRSLVPGDGQGEGAHNARLDTELKVRPFRQPEEGELAEMTDGALFLLAAVARHGSLTFEQAAAVTGYRVALAGILLTRLLDLGALAGDGDHYRVTTHWQPTVFRLLRRRNVLVS